MDWFKKKAYKTIYLIKSSVWKTVEMPWRKLDYFSELFYIEILITILHTWYTEIMKWILNFFKGHGGGHHGNDIVGPAVYKFGYGVKDSYSGNSYGHKESRDGKSAAGSYSVVLPDGRVQKVTYHVNGDSGFVADVTYSR